MFCRICPTTDEPRLVKNPVTVPCWWLKLRPQVVQRALRIKHFFLLLISPWLGLGVVRVELDEVIGKTLALKKDALQLD